MTAGALPIENRRTQIQPHELAERWLAALNRCLAPGPSEAAPQSGAATSTDAALPSGAAPPSTGPSASLSALFAADGHWRDLLAFDRTIGTHSGLPAIGAFLERGLAFSAARDFRIAARRSAPRFVTRAGREIVEALLEFTTRRGPGVGVLRLLPDPASATGGKAWILLTALDSLAGHEERVGQRRPSGDDYSREFGGPNWLDLRNRQREFTDADPAVLIIGAGQAGLSLAARLGRLGVDTLIIDRQARVGDNWRHRYHSLTLHNEVHVNHLPYLPFPDSWPVFIPKDKLANWFEFYADALELNTWMGSEWLDGHWLPDQACWQARVRRADGTIRVLKPRHLVFATGVSAIPEKPDLPGQSAFKGQVIHSGEYRQGSEWRGRPVVVLGTGNSGHDVAQDLHASGARVTLVQRSPTYVVSIREAQRVYSLYGEGMPVADCDLIATAMPYPVLRESYQLSTAVSRAADKPLHDALAARGFQLTFGSDETGFQMMYLRRGGGYYFNVGCSDLIADGSIALEHYANIDRFEAQGIRLRDGRTLAADLVVAATGYKNQQDVMRALLGDAIADRVGPIWNFGDDGELRNMWRATPQPGLWFTAGSLAQCRIYSKFLALQIKEQELARG